MIVASMMMIKKCLYREFCKDFVPHIRFSVTFSAMYALLLLFILYLLKMCTFQAQAEDYFYETIRH